MVGMSGVDEFGQMLTIYYHRDIPMKEAIFDIQLMNGPRLGNPGAQNNADGGRLDNWTEGLIKINTGTL